MSGKLGKHPARVDLRTLNLGKYLRDLPSPPSCVDWLSGISDWGMLGNDRLGDCVFASTAHAIQTWAAATGPGYSPTEKDVIGYYEKWAGYVPGDSSTDNGYSELDFLKHWRTEGYCGTRLVGFADPVLDNMLHIKQSIYLFGGVWVGLQLPDRYVDMNVWDVNGPPNPYNGHAVWINAYDDSSKLYKAGGNWGGVQLITYDFLDPNRGRYMDEAHCLLSQDWYDRADNDFHVGDLLADLKAL